MKSSIRIASGQGFWGDLPNAPINQVKKGPIDYLVLDYLAEVTMSILQKQKMKNPDAGYARDFVGVIEQILPDITERSIKVISNAGGVNPEACKDAILKLVEDSSADNITVAIVDGDDILGQIDTLIEHGHPLENMDTGEPIDAIKDKLLSANVYLGSRPVVEALQQDADIIITGRVADPSLTLAPMIYEFDWPFNDYDKMAAGIVAGHIIECGAQSSGGNFTDWEKILDFANIGFPIIEARPDGEFFVTKHEGTGGLINEMTVKEQLIYEIGDPAEYITPDCVVDFTSIHLTQDGENCVKVFGIEGKPETNTYKVSASYKEGYKLSATLVYSWPEALKKAQKASEILQHRANTLGLHFNDFRAEYIGVNGTNEQPITEEMLAVEYDEVQLRVSVSGERKDKLNRFGKEMAPLILTGPSGVTGYAGGRPKASPVAAYWPALLDKEAVKPRVRIFKSENI